MNTVAAQCHLISVLLSKSVTSLRNGSRLPLDLVPEITPWLHRFLLSLVHFSSAAHSLWACFCSVTKWHLTLCGPLKCSMPGYLPESAQTQVHWVSDAIQPSHPFSPPFPLAFNLSQHQGLFQQVSSSHQVAKVLELQLQSFQWIFRVDFL